MIEFNNLKIILLKPLQHFLSRSATGYMPRVRLLDWI